MTCQTCARWPPPRLQRDDVQPVANENLDRFLTGTITVLPILALGLVAWQVWSELLGWSDLIVFAIMYIATGLGITVGFHRLFTHRSFKTGKAVRAILAALGSAAIEGPVISWVADHRKHHAYSDKPGDPHSPHVDHGHGLKGALRGLLHAHVGWLFIHTERGLKTRYAPDLIADPVVNFINRTFVLWVLAGLAVPFLLGWAIGGTLADGPDRPAVGRRRADARAAPRDLQHQLALPLLRQAHASRPTTSRATSGGCRSSRSARRGTTTITRFPTSARHGLKRWHFDPSAWVIWALEKTGLAWDVVRIAPERQAAKLAT